MPIITIPGLGNGFRSFVRSDSLHKTVTQVASLFIRIFSWHDATTWTWTMDRDNDMRRRGLLKQYRIGKTLSRPVGSV